MARFSTRIAVDDKRVEIDVPKGTPAWRKANSIFCPLGPAPTRAWFVMQKGEVDKLSPNGSHTVTWAEFTAVDNDSGGTSTTTKTLTFPGLYLISAQRLLQGGVDDDAALYLVEFADVRLLLDRHSDSGNVIANVRSYANAQPYLTGTNRGWDGMLSDLWSACGMLGGYPGLPATLPIDGVPENTFFLGLNAWRALNAVLDQLDCAICRNPRSNDFRIVQLGEDQEIDPSSDTLKFDAQPIQTNAANAAEVLTFYFPIHRVAYGQERDAELAQNWLTNGSGEFVEVPSGVSGGVGTQALWDDLAVKFDANNVQNNQAAVQLRVANRTARYAARYSVRPKYQVHRGLVDLWRPGGQIRAVLWRSYDDGDLDDLGGTCTVWGAGPHLATLNSMGKGDGQAWFGSLLAAPEREPYSAPDFSRHTFANYPRLPNLVEVFHPPGQNPEKPEGNDIGPGDYLPPDLQVANGIKMHTGRVVRYVSQAMAVMDPCAILFVDNYRNAGGDVRATQEEVYGPARLSGVAVVGQLVRPVYVVRRGSGEDAAFVKVKISDKNDGDLVQANELGLFNAVVMRPLQDGYGLTEYEDCYLVFVDYFSDGDLTDETVAEQGKTYGLAKRGGEHNGLAVYEATITDGNQEWKAKTESPGDSFTKGQTGTFELYGRNGASGVLVSALCQFGDFHGDKWGVVKRMNGEMLASQGEC